MHFLAIGVMSNSELLKRNPLISLRVETKHRKMSVGGLNAVCGTCSRLCTSVLINVWGPRKQMQCTVRALDMSKHVQIGKCLTLHAHNKISISVLANQYKQSGADFK